MCGMSTPPVPRKQHVVSRVLLKRFASRATPTGGLELLEFNVRYGTERLRPPAAVGYVMDYLTAAASQAEQYWGEVENRLPAALAVVDDETVFEHTEHVETLKDCLALHLARSRTFRAIYDRLVQPRLAQIWERLMSDPAAVAEFRARHNGLWPAGPEALASVVTPAVEQAEMTLSAQFFRDQVMEHYEKARQLVAGTALQIARPEDGEFLIGDSPAQSLAAGSTGIGPLGGIPWDGGTTIILPLGPGHLLGRSKEYRWVSLDAAGVRKLNSAQVGSAQDRVMYRPGSGLGASVREILSTQAGEAAV